MEQQLKTPVVLIIFNRPDTTAKVFAEIARQKPQTLLVIADGPRAGHHDDAASCAAARAVVEKVDWPCTLLVNYSAINLGCKLRVSSGLDWVFGQVEEAVILEDDCLPHPDFFRFCTEMLERFRNDDRVAMVAGTNYLFDELDLAESYFFSRYFPIWGWATWRRAWSSYDISMQGWQRFRQERQLRAFYAQPFMRRAVTSMFDHACANRIDTWDIQWFFSCLFNNSLSLVPRRNLIANIGTTGTHTNGSSSSNFFPLFPVDPITVHPEKVFPNRCYDERFFKERIHRSLFSRAGGVYYLLRKKILALSRDLKRCSTR
jgi:hypothetical protein